MEDAVRMVFQSGFSSADTVEQSAGRGLGMDVVRNRIRTHGGRIHVHNKPGRGLSVSLVLPVKAFAAG